MFCILDNIIFKVAHHTFLDTSSKISAWIMSKIEESVSRDLNFL